MRSGPRLRTSCKARFSPIIVASHPPRFTLSHRRIAGQPLKQLEVHAGYDATDVPRVRYNSLMAGSRRKRKAKRIRPAKTDVQARVEFVRELIAKRALTSVIKSKFREKFGPADHTTILRYMLRAREAILADASRTRSEMKAESKAFYETFLNDPKVSARDKIRAQERLDKLMGLEERKAIDLKAEIVGEDATPQKVERIRRVLAAELERRGLATGVGGAASADSTDETGIGTGAEPDHSPADARGGDTLTQ